MKPLHLTLRQLQLFVAIAQTGSTAAASSAVALSQSAVSAALNELERLLDTQLFDRVGKRLVLNENGQELLKQAYPLLDMAGQIEHAIKRQNKYLQSVKIGASTTIGNHVLPKLLQQMVADSTELLTWNTEIVIHNTADICQQIAQFHLDIGLIEGPCHDPQLQSFPWLEDEMLVVMSPSHPFAQLMLTGRLQPYQIVSELQKVTWLLREQGSGTRDTSDQMLLPVLGQYRNILELSSSVAIKQCALYGLGLACLSRWVVEEELAAQRLMVVANVFPVTIRTCSWVLHQNKHLHPALQTVLQQLGCKTD